MDGTDVVAFEALPPVWVRIEVSDASSGTVARTERLAPGGSRLVRLSVPGSARDVAP